MEKEIENIVNVFFGKLDLNIKSIELIEEIENVFLITIKTDDIKESSLIIWPNWKNLDFLKNLLKLIIIKRLDKNIALHLEVNDYMHNKDEKLIKLVSSKIEIVKKKWKDIWLPFLSSYDRKKVHSFISEKGTWVFTESRWKGKDRRLYICHKWWFKSEQESKLTIDIDWNDI